MGPFPVAEGENLLVLQTPDPLNIPITMEAHGRPDQPSGSLSALDKPESGLFPYDENVIFGESSFFKKHTPTQSLPSPKEVREVANQSTDPRARDTSRPPPVCFPSVNLLVKYGTEVTLAEGQCLLLVRKALYPLVPVPEVYGWCRDGDQVFIYMELLDGITLEKSWEGFVEEDKISICQQLRHMVDAWRGLKQNFSPSFIGELLKLLILYNN